MTATLPVHINRETLHRIEVGDSDFEATDSFVVELRNHGRATHVHVNVDDDLSRVATIPDTNHYVETDATVPVRVTVAAGPRPLEGKLKVVTGYGAETAYVTVRLVEPDPAAESVPVDEELGKPQPRDPDPPSLSERFDVGESLPYQSLPVLLLALVAVAIVALAAAIVPGNLGLFAGVVTVLGGVALALFLLVGE